MSDNNTTSINEKAVILFEMLDIDSSKTLEKREILKAMRDNKKVKTIIETSKSLEPLLHPAKYKSIFSKINTSSDGHITLEEFSKFIDDVEQVAKKEEKEQDEGNKESNDNNNNNNNSDNNVANVKDNEKQAGNKNTPAKAPGPPPKEKTEKPVATTAPPPPLKKEDETAQKTPGPPKKTMQEKAEKKDEEEQHAPPPPPKKPEEKKKEAENSTATEHAPPPPPKKTVEKKRTVEKAAPGPPGAPKGPHKTHSSSNGEKKEEHHAPPPPKKPKQVEVMEEVIVSDSDSEADEREEAEERARIQLREMQEEMGIEEELYIEPTKDNVTKDFFENDNKLTAASDADNSKARPSTSNNDKELISDNLGERPSTTSTGTRPSNPGSNKRTLRPLKKKNQAPSDIYADLLPEVRVFELSPEHKKVTVPSLWGWRPASRAQTAPTQTLPGIGKTAEGLNIDHIYTKEERGILLEDAIQKLPMTDGLEHLFKEVNGLLEYTPTARRFQDIEERNRKTKLMKKFRYHHAHLFFTQIREILVILQNLPNEWGIPYFDEYWSWHFHNIADNLNYALREVDWLPEQAKPACRAPQLAINDYKEYVIGRARKIAEEDHHHISPRKGAAKFDGNEKHMTQMLSPALPRATLIKLPKRDQHIASWFALLERALKILQCKKGAKAICKSMIALCKYTPEAKRFKEEKKRNLMVQHVLNFHLDVCRKAFHSFENVINAWTVLPSDWIDVNNNFWEMQLQEDAALVESALNEVDWLPEAAKATFRRAVYTLEVFEKYTARIVKASRSKAKSQQKRERRPSVLPRMTGVGFFPEQHLIMSHDQQKDLQVQATKILPNVKKGLEAITAAVEALKNFKPAAGRYQDLGEKRMRLAELNDFAQSQAQKFHIELKQIVHLRKQLPDDWVDKYNSYWLTHLQDIAFNMQEALMEIDWLPEAAKPTLRAAYLRMEAYKQHIKREVHRDYNRRALDLETYLRESIVRVNGKRTKSIIAKEKEIHQLKINLNEKEKRSKEDGATLGKETTVRLREHWLMETLEKANDDVIETEKIIGREAVNELKEAYKDEFDESKNLLDLFRDFKSQKSETKRRSPGRRPYTAGDNVVKKRRNNRRGNRSLSRYDDADESDGYSPGTPFYLQSREERLKLKLRADKAIDGIKGFSTALKTAITNYKMQRHIDSQKKAINERSECAKRVTRRKRKIRKKKIKVFDERIDKILKLKEKEGLVPRKTFR